MRPLRSIISWISKVFSSGRGVPSIVRIMMFLVVLEILRFVDAIRITLLATHSIPETPLGTAGFLAGVLGILATIKSYSDRLESKEP